MRNARPAVSSLLKTVVVATYLSPFDRHPQLASVAETSNVIARLRSSPEPQASASDTFKIATGVALCWKVASSFEANNSLPLARLRNETCSAIFML
jgi:hypothetical protein